MLRLAEYFVVVGYDFEKSKRHEGRGKILQKLPNTDWDDYKFETQVEMFCQPQGWELSNEKKPPTFFVCYLTDPLAKIYYLACLSFHEAVTPAQLQTLEGKNNGVSRSGSRYSRHIRNESGSSSLQIMANGEKAGNYYFSDGSTEQDDDYGTINNLQEDPNLIKPADRFAPKSLILLARHGYLDILKNCLSIIYSIYMDPHREISLEYVVSNILSCVDVPPIGGNRIPFTVGAGDKQVVQPPVCPTLPVTRNCISMLFKHLGMQNVLLIFCSLINDDKILLHSRSLNRLTEACHAFRSLLYPLKYGNVFIPIIPKSLIDVLSSPTPFLAGIHSDCRPTFDLCDLIVVDIDGGSVKFPEEVSPLQLNEPYYSVVMDSLTKILNPDLLTADEIYPPEPSPPTDSVWQDKQLRAVFIRLFCRLFAGYRSCLTLTRIRPKPVIHFNQLIFLLLRGLRNDNDEFVTHLLNCMSFGQFIQERGTPYRICDVFDEEYDSMTELLQRKTEQYDDLPVIDKLAKKLYDNENRGAPVNPQLPSESKSGHTRLHAQPFQLLDETLIADYIKTNLRNKVSSYKPDPAKPRFVPHGLELDMQIFNNRALFDKNKVIKEFVASIFNNHITEALKRRNTVRQDLKNRLIRRIFIDELYRQLHPDLTDATSNLLSPTTSASAGHQQKPSSTAIVSSEMSCERRALLEYQQFELVNDLMCEALRQEGQNEDSGVAPIIMDLSTKFCTQLGNTRYYSNMTAQIQQHPVWESQKFWINCFCDRVDQEIRQLYLHYSEKQYRQMKDLDKQTVSLISQSSGSGSIKTSESKLAGSKTSGVHSRNFSDRSWSHNAGIVSQPSLLGAGKKSSNNTSASEMSKKSSVTTNATPPSNTMEYYNTSVNRKLYTNRMSALDMAAEEMKMMDICPSINSSSNNEALSNMNNSGDSNITIQQQEVSTIYAQILHFINLIVNFRIPLNIVARMQSAAANATSGMNTGGDMTGGNSHHQNQHPDSHRVHFDDDDVSNNSDNCGSESGLNDDARWVRNKTTNLEVWLKKFVDKTASANSLDSHMIESRLKSKIEGIIEGHISNLEAIYPEVQNIPKVKKVEVTSPVLLPDEQVILICSKESVRCQLLLDGRHERLDLSRQREQDFENTNMGASMLQNSNVNAGRILEDEDDYDNLRPLLPAQGALFITNYRIVFRGAPKDPFQSNKLVCRSFPVSAIQSIKKLGNKTFMSNTGQMVQNQSSLSNLWSRGLGTNKSRSGDYCSLDVVRIRSNTFQMLKIGFDLDDGNLDIKEELIHKLFALRYPPILMLSFNLTEKIVASQMKSAYCTGLPDENQPYNSGPAGSYMIEHGSNVILSQQAHSVYSNSTKNTFNKLLRLQSNSNSGGTTTAYTGTESSLGAKSRTCDSESGSELSYAITGQNDFSLDPSGNMIATESVPIGGGSTPSPKDHWWWALSSERIKKTLMLDKPGYRDVLRALQLTMRDATELQLSSNAQDDVGGDDNVSIQLIWRFNQKHETVSTYPAMVAVPSSFTEAKLRKVAKSHKKNRLPVIIWKNSRTGSLLIRGSSFQSKGILGKLRKQPGSSQSGSGVIKTVGATLHKPLAGGDQEITAAKEQIRYLRDLVHLSPSYDQIKAHLEQFSQDTSTNSPSGSNFNGDYCYGQQQQPLVPWNDQCRFYTNQNRKNAFDKVVKNIKAGGEKAKKFPGFHSFRSYPIPSSNSAVTNTSGAGSLTDKRIRTKNTALTSAAGLSVSRESLSSAIVHDEADEEDAESKANRLIENDGMGEMVEKLSIRGGVDHHYHQMGGRTLPNTMPGNTGGGGSSGVQGGHLQSELRVVRLYILGDKSMKNLSKYETLRDIEFIAVDYASKKQIEEAYDSLLKAVLPDNVVSLHASATTTNSNSLAGSGAARDGAGGIGGGAGSGGYNNSGGNMLTGANQTSMGTGSGISVMATGGGHSADDSHASLAVGSAKWLQQVQSLLQLSGTVVDLMDLQGSSVAVCLENGWDATAQVVSLAQIMMDPYYRTLEGFWSLIEKDWLDMGHPFRSRTNMSSSATAITTVPGSSNQPIGQDAANSNNTPNYQVIIPPAVNTNTAKSFAKQCTPVFLQFLDAIHQIMSQFPMAFQFNEFLLRFLAYHHISSRFYDFKYDCESDKLKWLFNTIVPIKMATRIGSSNSDNLVNLVDNAMKQHSIFEYIKDHHQQWPIFFNFNHCPTFSQRVLRPCTNMAVLQVWRYYLEEDLSSGSVYDLDHFCPRYRRRNSRNYDPVLHGAFNNSHVESVYGVMGLREGSEPGNWFEIWKAVWADSEKEVEALLDRFKDLNDHVGDEDNTLRGNMQLPSNISVQLSDYSQKRTKLSREQVIHTREVVKMQHKYTSLRKLDRCGTNVERMIGDETRGGSNAQLYNNESAMTSSAYNNDSSSTSSLARRQHNDSTQSQSATNINDASQCIVHDKRTINTINSSNRASPNKQNTGATNDGNNITRPIRPPPPKTSINPSNMSSVNGTATNSSKLTSNDHLDKNASDKSKTTSNNHIQRPGHIQKSSISNNLTSENSHNHFERIPNSSSISGGAGVGSLSESGVASEPSESTSTDIAYSGELFKLSPHPLFPGWQKKYFALDVIHHAIFYYDLKDSVKTNRKKIDLQDITGVRILKTIPNHQKRFQDYAFLELQTEEKVYKLANDSPAIITEWVEKIQTSIG